MLTQNEIAGMTVEKFAERQGCEYIRSHDGTRLIFENGAAVRVVDEIRGTPTATDFSEPPVDDTDELSLRRRLLFVTLKHEREVEAFLKAKADVAWTIQMRQSTARQMTTVPPPHPDAVSALERGAARCADLKARAEELHALIEALPSVQAKRRQQAQNRAEEQAAVDRDKETYRRAMALTVDLPDAMRTAAAKATSHI